MAHSISGSQRHSGTCYKRFACLCRVIVFSLQPPMGHGHQGCHEEVPESDESLCGGRRCAGAQCGPLRPAAQPPPPQHRVGAACPRESGEPTAACPRWYLPGPLHLHHPAGAGFAPCTPASPCLHPLCPQLAPSAGNDYLPLERPLGFLGSPRDGLFLCKCHETVRLHDPDTPPDMWPGSALSPASTESPPAWLHGVASVGLPK